MADHGPRRVPLMVLFGVFLRIGSTAFGGLAAVLALLEAEMVEKRRLLTTHDLSEALAATKLLPGSTLIQIVAYLGYRLGGRAGSVLASVAFLVPSTLLMLSLAALRISPTGAPGLASVIRGISLAVVGLLITSICRFARSGLDGALAVAVALAALVAGGFFGLPAAPIVLTAGLVGILWPPDGGAGRSRPKETAR
jgi:chromate transporter